MNLYASVAKTSQAQDHNLLTDEDDWSSVSSDEIEFELNPARPIRTRKKRLRRKMISQASEEAMKIAFQQVDKDGRGFIAAKDISCVLASLGQESDISEMLQEANIDGDGEVSYQELLKMMTSN